jgi:hypothetical protein
VIIAKFALLFFLMMLAWMVVLRQDRGPVYGGPFYYADPPDSSNPVRPQYRLSFAHAWASDRCVEVYCNGAGEPLLAKHLVHHQVAWQMVWIWDKSGRLMRRYTEDPQGNITKTDVLPTPETEPPAPTF